jgi:hypothetical protein
LVAAGDVVEFAPNHGVSLVRKCGLLGALAFDLQAVDAPFVELLGDEGEDRLAEEQQREQQ